MIRKITILLIILLALNMVNGQIPSLIYPQKIDSLLFRLKVVVGTDSVDVLNGLALHFAPLYFDSSLNFAKEALHLSEQLNYIKGKGIATFNMGNSYYFRLDVQNALRNYLDALRILEPFEPSKEIGNLLIQLGAVNQYVHNIDRCSAFYRRAISNFSKLGDSVGMMYSYAVLSRSFYNKFQIQSSSLYDSSRNILLDSALKYNKFVLDFVIHHPGTLMMAEAYNREGIYFQFKNDTSALNYFLKSLEVSSNLVDTNLREFMKGILYLNLGVYYYYYRNNLDLGFSNNLLALDLFKKSNSHDVYSLSIAILGEIELDRGHYPHAEKFLLDALNASDNFLTASTNIVYPDPTYRLWGIPEMRVWRTGYFRDFVNLYELIGDYKNALLYQKKLEEENGILTRDELNRQIIGLQVNFENDMHNEQLIVLSKEKELAHLKLNRSRLWFASLGSTGIIVFLLILLYFQRKKHTIEQNALLLKQRLLRSQMNPHFIFNSLSGIQNFIVTEKPTKASIYLSKFATLVRNILDSSVKEYVTLEKEITTIENYLELQKVRYFDKFDFSIKTDDAIDPETTMIPPMLAQPFIENAIEHGIVHSEKMGQIDVEFKLENDVILFEVRDNGVGREKAKKLEAHFEKDHQSMSTSITLERLAMLNKKRKHKIIFEITDLKDTDGMAAGTFVRFGIPL